MKNKSFEKKFLSVKNKILSSDIDYLILTNSNEFFFEYLPDHEKRIQDISGFSGSNATIIFTKGKAAFFTDGRYTLQAKKELNQENYIIIDIGSKSVISWVRDNIKAKENIYLDPKFISIKYLKKLDEVAKLNMSNIKFCEIDKIINFKKKSRIKHKAIFALPIDYSGSESDYKIKKITDNLKEDAMLIANSESICWTLNIRGADTKYSPLIGCYMLLTKNGEVNLFSSLLELQEYFKNDIKQVKTRLTKLYLEISKTKKKYTSTKKISTISIDPNEVNFAVKEIFDKIKISISENKNPVIKLKSIKNKTEIKNARTAHFIDGLALTKFLYWIDCKIKNGEIIYELDAEKKLLQFRKKNKNFLYPSFRTISASGKNGAIIHYNATKNSNKKICKNSIYLVDSGGQYFHGTTDVTRTVSFTKKNKEICKNYTLVLKGHINLASAKISSETNCAKIDSLARSFLLQHGRNYAHGTGHGVGSFLSVHEGPISISPNSIDQKLESGMIMSNEPGYYKENSYGIRIESLVLVKKSKGLISFDTLTTAPIDSKLVDFNLLSIEEKKWLYNYHKKILKFYKEKLTEREFSWLEHEVNTYKNKFKKVLDN